MPKTRYEFPLHSFKNQLRREFDFRETPITLQCEIKYRRRGVYPGWDNRRVERLARRLGVTLPELLAMCAEFDFDLAKRCIQKNHWPSSLSLHFAILEETSASDLKGPNGTSTHS